jgi:hypothetical protein
MMLIKFVHVAAIDSLSVALCVVGALCSLACHAQQPPTGSVIAAIRTVNGSYLTAVNGGDLGGQDSGPAAVALHTDATVAGARETFTIVWLNSTYTQFALRTSNGDYVTAVNGGGLGGPNDSSAPIHTDATAAASWERFRLNFLPNNQVTINVPDGRFLTAVNGGGMSGSDSAPIHTDAVTYGAWETFTLVKYDAAPAADRQLHRPRRFQMMWARRLAKGA